MIPTWEQQYWEDILDEATNKSDEVEMELAMKHLYPVYPEVEDTALLDDEIDDIPVE